MTIPEAPLRRALYRALRDPLTGLANRTLLMDRATHALARGRRRTSTVAVLCLDLDRFKVINDSLGFAAGDELLIAVAERLEETVRITDLVARIGGDEFVILAEGVDGTEEAVALSHRLREAVAQPVRLAGGERVVITASVGIALAGPGDHQPSSLLWDADIAMYRAKESGRDGYALFEDGLRAASLNRFRAEALLRRAIEDRGLRLHYQPLIEVATGRTIGAEALVRVADPDRGLIEPAEFLDVAEETGLIVPLGSWVVAEAAAQAGRWAAHLADRAPVIPIRSVVPRNPVRSGTTRTPSRRPGAPDFTMCVNLSGRQLAHPAFLGEIDAALDRSRLDPGSFCFEITEPALADATSASLRSLEALKDKGVRLAIDDFGTGQASLTWLRRLPVDILKVDQTFVAGLGTDPDDTAIVRAVVGLGQSLGLTTVAEGVETPAQLGVLRDLGCDWAQGFHFAHPGPPEAVTQLLR